MNIYHRLNKVIDYIETHLEEEIKDKELSKILGVNPYMMHRLFSILLDISLTDYIRSRRLSNAGYDLCKGNEKIIDLAFKYGYENATSFSRAFTKFHGMKPSLAKQNPSGLKVFPRLTFKEEIKVLEPMEYTILELPKMILYGKGIKTDDTHIGKDAPRFFKEMRQKYGKKYGDITYGMVVYEARFDSDEYEYWTLYDKEIKEFVPYVIPKGKWLCFEVPTDEAEDIQRVSRQFYEEFVPSSKYRFRDIPELEYYHDNRVSFLVPID